MPLCTIRRFKAANKWLINKWEHDPVTQPVLGRFTRMRKYCEKDRSSEMLHRIWPRCSRFEMF